MSICDILLVRPPASPPQSAVLSADEPRGAPSAEGHLTPTHRQMLAILATSLATLELTPDTWESALSGKSAMVK